VAGDREIGVYVPERRGGEENATKDPRAGAQHGGTAEDSAVRVQREVLEELGQCQAALERYVRTSFGLQARLTSAIQAGGWLFESKAQPEKLGSDDYWQRGQIGLVHTVLFADLEDREVAAEPAFAADGARFDIALEAAMALIGEVLTGSSHDTPDETRGKLEPHLSSMQSSASRLLDSSKREVDRVMKAMGKELAGIFSRMESEREALRMFAEQQAQRPATFDVSKSQTDGESTANYTRSAGRKGAGEFEESREQEEHMQSEFKNPSTKPAISRF
jgi:hypothetical protein